MTKKYVEIMYRAIPEVSKLCSMQSRSRQYKLHLEALNRIRAKSAQPSNAVNRHAKTQSALKAKARREELAKINYENQKMKNAIVYRPSYINRADFKAHELDHEHQVARMTGQIYSYGFDESKKKRSYHSSLNATLEPLPNDELTSKPKPTKTVESVSEKEELHVSDDEKKVPEQDKEPFEMTTPEPEN